MNGPGKVVSTRNRKRLERTVFAVNLRDNSAMIRTTTQPFFVVVKYSRLKSVRSAYMLSVQKMDIKVHSYITLSDLERCLKCSTTVDKEISDRCSGV